MKSWWVVVISGHSFILRAESQEVIDVQLL